MTTGKGLSGLVTLREVQEIGYSPNYFSEMLVSSTLASQGSVELFRHLMIGPASQSGFES